MGAMDIDSSELLETKRYSKFKKTEILEFYNYFIFKSANKSLCAKSDFECR